MLASAGLTEWYTSIFEAPVLVSRAQRGPAFKINLTERNLASVPDESAQAPPLADSFPHSERTLPISEMGGPTTIGEAFSQCLPSIDTGFLRPHSLFQADLDQLLETDAMKESIVEYETDDTHAVRRLVVRSREGLLSCYIQDDSLFCECLKAVAPVEASTSETTNESKR